MTEQGNSHRYYGANDPLTKDVMNTTGVRIARMQIQQGYLQPDENGNYVYYWQFNTPQKFWDATVNMNMAEHYLGGHTIRVLPNGDGTVTFRVTNSTNWESGTRNPANFMGSQNSWEGLFLGILPCYQNREERFIFPEDLLPESIFIDRPREEVHFGGRMTQTFEWQEKLQTEPLTYQTPLFLP